ncbi:tRNA1(Val) (adenine(37)-N6)-methyltransferase [Acidisoma sp. C75]
MQAPEVTEGYLLGKALRYAQPRTGYRTGIEPVLLAAAVPARPGEQVLEAGTGAGAGLLCLAARLPGLRGLGLEIEPGMAAIAARNFADNDFAGLAVRVTDLARPGSLADLHGAFDHAMANPPWHPAEGTAPAEPLRHRAKVAPAGLIGGWVTALAPCLRHRGTLTLVLPARALPEALAALAPAALGAPVIFPLWPRAGRAARIFLLQARRGGRAECRILPGLLLHEGLGYTPAAARLLAGAGALDLSASG